MGHSQQKFIDILDFSLGAKMHIESNINYNIYTLIIAWLHEIHNNFLNKILSIGI
jgi:hypothetical protein